MSTIPQIATNASLALLPAELVQSLNQTYFLHLLVNDPDKVVPPGKSVLSMIQHADFRLPQEEHKEDANAALVERVKLVAHKAFWKEATEVLSSPVPSVQLPRLRRLYQDLHEALSPLFPPKHRILATLIAPPAPTSSPLHSTLDLLREILTALRQRCAPVRDERIGELLSSISLPFPATVHPPQSSVHSELLAGEIISPLAEFVVDMMKAILSLAEDMKSDLNNFILGSMTDDQLIGVLSSEVKMRERETVLQLWGGTDAVRSSWRAWLSEGSRRDSILSDRQRWIDKLLKALESDKPINCLPPSMMPPISDGSANHVDSSPQTNALPPQLFFYTAALFSLQNHLQAIVIAAALRLLARPPHTDPKLSSPTAASTEPDLIQRVWPLLKTEIDSDNVDSETKIINLADEVVRARQKAAPTPLMPEDEKRIRDSVDRTLRSTDPVFLLLRKRLVDALETRLLADAEEEGAGRSSSGIPTKMQTGRDTRSGKRPRLMMPSTSVSPSRKSPRANVQFQVLGFEDDVVRQAISDVYQKLTDCIIWTESVWGDLV